VIPGQQQDIDAGTRTRIIIGVMLGSFLGALDTTILATVMPTIVGELGGLHLYSWVFSVYMIMTAVSMPLWGRLSDTMGKKTLFTAAVGLFLLGSVLCGMSASMFELILFRGIQGIGAGGLASVPFALVSTVFPPRDRGKALGVLASVWGISSVIGPLLGSAIVTYAHWRWVFYVNVPLGAAAVATIAKHFADMSVKSREPIDYAGAGYLALSIVSLLLAVLGFGGAHGEAGARVIVFLLFFVLFAGLFVRRETVAPHPLLDLALFKRRAFWVGNVLGFVSSFAMYGIIAFVPLFAQSVQGGTAMRAGLVITPMSLAWSASSFAAGRLTRRLGENTLTRAGMGLMAAGFLLTLVTTYNSSIPFLMLCVATVGAGMGCQTPSLMLTVQHSVEQRFMGVATSTQMLARTIGGAVGVSVMGSAVTSSMIRDFAALEGRGGLDGFPGAVRQLIGDPQKLLGNDVRALLSPDQVVTVLTIFTQALHAVFVTGLVTIVAGLALSALLPPSSMHLPHADDSHRPGS
jgi:EmrB/QacA subfamily drug resistance transporter